MPSHGKKPPDPRKVKPRPRDRRRPVSPGTRNGKNPDACCPMLAALQSIKRGKFRLARRYARMSIRLMVVRFS